MGYGELDLLRDTDGRLYVVDANNTPYWPQEHLSRPQRKRALALIAASYERLLERFAA